VVRARRCGGEVPGTPAIPDVDPKPSGRRNNRGMASLLEEGNPPHVQRIPKMLENVRIYAFEMAYVETPQQTEAPRAFRRRVYDTLRTVQLATK
jgi:hypothetical protein